MSYFQWWIHLHRSKKSAQLFNLTFKLTLDCNWELNEVELQVSKETLFIGRPDVYTDAWDVIGWLPTRRSFNLPWHLYSNLEILVHPKQPSMLLRFWQKIFSRGWNGSKTWEGFGKINCFWLLAVFYSDLFDHPL